VISPILANVYLHELDCYVARLITDFEKGKVRAENPAYKKGRNAANWLSKRIEQT
jgi:RNA-directed DNA polymerase